MGFPYDRSNNPLAPVTYGRNWNFFQKITVTSPSFNTTNCDMIITFISQGIMILNETSSTIVQVSFNGTDIADEINSSLISGVSYDNRVVSKIWFKISSGASATISVRAWSIQ
jgi:hypothetical protein